MKVIKNCHFAFVPSWNFYSFGSSCLPSLNKKRRIMMNVLVYHMEAQVSKNDTLTSNSHIKYIVHNGYPTRGGR